MLLIFFYWEKIRCKEFASLRFLEFVFITSLNNSCEQITDSGLTRSLDQSDSTRFYGSFESLQHRIGSQGGHSAAKPATVPPTMKNAKLGLENNSTKMAKGRKMRLLRRLLGDSGLEEMAWRRLVVILIALDCFVLFRRMFCLYEKFESFRHCLRKHPAPPAPPPPPPSKVCGNFEEGRTNLKTAADPMEGSAPSKAGPGDDEDDEEDAVAFDSGSASYHPPSISRFDEKSRSEKSRNITCCSNFIIEEFLRTLWNGILNSTGIPELVAVAVVTTILLSGVNVLSRRMETQEFDDNWTDIADTWTTWTNRREEGNRKMESEGKIISELVYLDATISHLCTGR